MARSSTKTPVTIIGFRRPEFTQKVLDVVREWRPQTLNLICDGPRNTADIEPCAAVKRVFEQVDWDCEVHRDYAEQNMGLRKRVHSGLSAVFERCDRSIILEDDCVPHSTFYRFCDELLDRYEEDESVGLISGDNAHGFVPPGGDSYTFSRYSLIWGWATWARAWSHYDLGYDGWPDARDSHFLYSVFNSFKSTDWWSKTFERNRDGGNSWATIWLCSNLLAEARGVQPAVNLVSNVGFGEEATHTKGPNLIRERPDVFAVDKVLRHPPCTSPSDECDMLIDKIVYSRDPFIYRGGGGAHYPMIYAKAMRHVLTEAGADVITSNFLIATYFRQIERGVKLSRTGAKDSVEAVVEAVASDKLKIPLDEGRYISYVQNALPRLTLH